MEETLLGRGADGKLYTLGDNNFCALGDGKSGNHNADTWTLVQPPAGENGRVYDVKSGSLDNALDGTAFNTW